MAKPQQKRGNNSKGSSKSFTSNKNGKGKQSYRKGKDITDIFEADDDQRQLQRKGHDLDEVDNYEYQVGDIQDDDDEEIDSDEAFDESDDDRFDNFKFSGSTKPSDKKHLKKKASTTDNGMNIEVNLDESEHSGNEDDESDVDGDDYMDIADMLDDNEPPAAVVDKESVRTLLPEDDTDDSEVDEFMGFSDNDDEGDEDDNGQDVVDFITSLDTKKRKRGVDKNGIKKHKPLAERSEIYQENEFNLPVQQPSKVGGKKKLDLKDLMGSMDGEASMGGLRDAVKAMSDNTAKQAALSAPLPQRIQDRMERQAAYTEAKKEVSRWEPTVKENREAEHLSFPMQQSVTDHKVTSAALASKFIADTDMEKEIEQALQDAGMKDAELEAFEALKLNKLSVEEVEARRKELGMMRELMFRHEMKAKRMKKIKSKSYRKLKRQEKTRLDEQMSKLQELDHEISHEDQEEAALSRAEERMSLKHKNTGKWAKRALARGQQDEGTRDAIMEQLQRGEQLRRKIQGQDSDDDDDEAGSGYESGDAMDEKTRISMELDALENDFDKEDGPKKGIFAMKFMQDAAKRQQQANKEDLDQFRNEWLDENSDNDEKDPVEPAYSHVANNPGRITFGSTKNANKKKEPETLKEETTTAAVKVNDAGQIDKISLSAGHTTRTSGSVKTSTPSPLADLDSLEANPWLQNDTSRLSKKASKSNKATKGKKIQPKEDEEEDVELDTTNILSVKAIQPAKSSSSKKANSKKDKDDSATTTKTESATVTSNHAASFDDDDDDDHDVPAPTMVATSNKLAFNQRELVARAFANDDVLDEFEEEKEAVIAEDGDKVEDLTLPGWGSWGGDGMKKKNKKKFTKITKGIDADKRKDSKLASVIINEKRHKKSEKYQAAQVPFPFKSMEQYEHSLRAPVGQEWNTRASYQNMTKPRVMTKLGTVIDPLSVPFK
ncbi:small-subunit processome [Absidia repens]|uniref:Small-subunit processome n=1 Tax=Absidia repens TaxID=90262 RepID=A0A1X2I9K1_9FUNG|nr:small-subunit processome [Absidia repens]